MTHPIPATAAAQLRGLFLSLVLDPELLFGRILSTIPLLLGYFWMLWDSEKQTWHDKLAGSVVVPVDAYR